MVSADWYDQFHGVGLRFGPRFRRLTHIHATTKRQVIEADLRLDDHKSTDESRYILHPAILDAALQISIIASI